MSSDNKVGLLLRRPRSAPRDRLGKVTGSSPTTRLARCTGRIWPARRQCYDRGRRGNRTSDRRSSSGALILRKAVKSSRSYCFPVPYLSNNNGNRKDFLCTRLHSAGCIFKDLAGRGRSNRRGADFQFLGHQRVMDGLLNWLAPKALDS